MIKTITAMLVLLAILVSVPVHAQTMLVARTGFGTQHQTRTYDLVEVFQVRGKWIVPDGGYIDFADGSKYRELFIGGGAVLLSTKHFTIIEEAYLDKATGPTSGGALYFQPWTLVGFKLTARLGGEAVYFPYLPLNKAGRIQHVIERAKLEYDFKHFKVGGGYGAYQFGDGPWQSKPFITTTLKAGSLGSLELWLQRMPGSTAQVQLRYFKAF